eukprot:3854474-Prymnesium_polylepis.1
MAARAYRERLVGWRERLGWTRFGQLEVWLVFWREDETIVLEANPSEPNPTFDPTPALRPSANALVQWPHAHVPPEARLALCSRLRGAQEGRLRLQLDR